LIVPAIAEDSRVKFFPKDARHRGFVVATAILSISVFVGACGKPKPATRHVRQSPGSATQSSPTATESEEVFETGSAPGRTHIVQPQETLYGLAQRYYGNANQWRKIYYANRNRLTDPNDVPAGIRLIIP
jgi:nucleoid-associated protein YgaU